MFGGIRVTHAINGLGRGGAERLLTQLLPRLHQAGIRCEVLSLHSAEGHFKELLRDAGIAVSTLDTFAYSPAAPWTAPRWFARADCDILHAHLYPTQLFAALARQFFQTHWAKLIATEHNTFNWRRRLKPMSPAERWMYRRYDAIACISVATRDALLDAVGNTVPMSVVPNGIDLDAWRHLAVNYSSANTSRAHAILTAGRLTPQKAMHRLIDAVPYLLPGTRVLICGDGPLRRSLEQRAAMLRTGLAIEFLGQRDDLPTLLRSCRVYVQTSNYEGFGLAALEAMALGVPVVHGGCPGLADVVGNGGVSTDAASPRALAAAINNLLADESEWRRLSENATERANTFGIEHTVEAYAALYENLVRGAEIPAARMHSATQCD